MSGILGNWELFGGIPQSVYLCDNSDSSVVNVNVCNRGNVTARISMAISNSETSPLNAEWVEFESQLVAKGTLERTGIVLNPGQYIIVKSSQSNVNAVAWGVTSGESEGLPAITQNLGSAPVWFTSTGTIETAPTGSVQFSASENTSSYSLASGSLPAGSTLDSTTGVLSGFTAPGTATNYTFTLRATSSTGFTTDRTFTVRVNTSGAPVVPVIPTVTTTFTYNGTDQTYTVPAGRTSIAVYLWAAGGAGGGNDSAGETSAGGGGGAVQHTSLSVTPGEVLTLRMGQGPSYIQGSNGQTTNGNWVTGAIGGGGLGGAGDGGGANGTFGGPGGGATSILRGGSVIIAAGGGGGGGGAGYNDSGSGPTGGAGGSGTGSGGSGAGTTAQAGTSGSAGGGGGGGGGSGSSQAAGNGQPGAGGPNTVPVGGTGFTATGTTPGNNGSIYYPSGAGTGGGLVTGGSLVSAGHGAIVIVG